MPSNYMIGLSIVVVIAIALALFSNFDDRQGK